MRGGVFVCHASQDAGVAQRVVVALERADVPCWIAPRDIEPGEEYTQAILEGLEAAPAVVLVFSAATNESPHVRRELETTVGSDTPIIPVRTEAVEPSRSLRYFIGTAQWLDAVGTAPGEWEDGLVRGVRRALEKGGNPGPGSPPVSAVAPATAAPPRRSPQGWLVPGLVAVAVLLVAVAVGLVVTDDDDPGGATPEPGPSSTSTGPTEPTEAETGDEPTEATEPTESDTPPDAAQVVFEDTFDGSSTALKTGPQDLSPGRIFRDLVNGGYVVRVNGIPEGNKAWTTVGAPGLQDSWSVSTEVVSQQQHGCGVMVEQGAQQLTAVLDRATGIGEIMWFSNGDYVNDQAFAAVPGDEGRLSLSREGDRLVVRVGDAEAARLPPPGVGSPTIVGVALVGAENTCVFDDFQVTR